MKFVLKELKNSINVSSVANVHFFEFPTDYFTKSDSHPFSELLFVESGSVKVSSDNYNGMLKKGELIIHRPNEKHFLQCTANNEPIVVIIGFECNSKELDIFSRHPFKLNNGNLEVLSKIVKEGRNVFAPPYNVPVYNMKEKKDQIYGSLQMLKILLEAFFINLIREYKFNDDVDRVAKTAQVGEIIKYVEDNFLEKISIDELAFLFGTNRSSLCKIFKENTGKTIGDFISYKKTEFAKKEITETDKTFTEIAEEMNFDTIHYFSNFFKKQVGCYPKEYRKIQVK